MYDKIPSSVSVPTPSCLDAAYERKAIDDGFVFDPEDLFPENKQYYLTKRTHPCSAHGSLDPNVEAVKEQLSQRSKVGFKKYGTLTNRGDLTTDQWLQHLQEELMDACVYIEVLKGKIK
jgi:hypothetical protein